MLGSIYVIFKKEL